MKLIAILIVFCVSIMLTSAFRNLQTHPSYQIKDLKDIKTARNAELETSDWEKFSSVETFENPVEKTQFENRNLDGVSRTSARIVVDQEAQKIVEGIQYEGFDQSE